MQRKHVGVFFLAAAVCFVGFAVSRAQTGAAAAPTTLWNFLGIPQGVNKILDATLNRRGNFPKLERRPPLKGLADPANLESPVPAIKEAAKIKQAEDLAPQKIKAIKYLAKIGCGCYPGVKEALMQATEDCTEKVRYAAVKAIGRAAKRKCELCKRGCCCDEEMTKQLAKIAYEKDEQCCWLEPSERVREAAAEAMRACCEAKQAPPGTYPAEEPEETEDIPEEPGTAEEDIPVTGESSEDTPADEEMEEEDNADAGGGGTTSSRRRSRPAESEAALPSLDAAARKSNETTLRVVTAGSSGGSGDVAAREASTAGAAEAAAQVGSALFGPPPHRTVRSAGRGDSAPARVRRAIRGVVAGIEVRTGTLTIDFDGARPQVGTRGKIHHQFALQTSVLGEVEVVHFAGNGLAIAQPMGRMNLTKVSRGDVVVFQSSETVREPQRQPVRTASRTSRTAPSKAPSVRRSVVAQDAVDLSARAVPADDSSADGEAVAWIEN